MQELVETHQDALIVTLQIANCKLKRALIDNESSVNIMFLPALNEMQLDESLIIRDTTIFIEFYGEAKQTVGEIVFPIFISGINFVISSY